MNHYNTIKKAIEIIERRDSGNRTFSDLAAALGLSQSHLRKIFIEWTGISPKQFDRYLRLTAAKNFLDQRKNHMQTVLLSGLSSGGRLHDLFTDIEAMTPGQYQNGGQNLTIYYSTFTSRFGEVLVAATSRGICNILFCKNLTDGRKDLRSRWPKASLVRKIKPAHQVIKKYFNNLTTTSKIKFHVHGTNFQIKVWEALLSIPLGNAVSYGDIAARIGAPKAVRAVGSAVGDNPVCFIIPCHRVLRANGDIGGYYWGLDRKRTMLAYEEIKSKANIE